VYCPSLNIFGSFFPSWMLCGLIGLLAAIVLYKLLSVLRTHAALSPALLFYPSVTLTVTFSLWLIFYGG
jgi:hypothetical protein